MNSICWKLSESYKNSCSNTSVCLPRKKKRKKSLKNYDLTRTARWYLVTRRAMQIISHDRKHVSEVFFSFLCFEGVDETIQKIELHVIPHRIHETWKSIVNSYLPVSVREKNPKTILLNFVSVRSSHHLVTCQHSPYNQNKYDTINLP